jgi:GTP-binding protein
VKVVSSKFIKSAVKSVDYPELDLPEIAFAGRSNVGKSSLINKIIQRKSLAKTSSTPGKTRLINFFVINDEIGFVDLPGYGYAKVSKTERKSWGAMIERYMSGREELQAVVLLQDIRREQTEMDCMMMEMVRHHGIPIILVLTKADKFTRGKQNEIMKKRCALLEPGDVRPILFSSVTGAGKDELWQAILDAINDED